MRSLAFFLQHPFQKIIFFFCLSNIFLVSMSPTKFLAKQAGGVACFLIVLLLILSLIKTLLLELVNKPKNRNKSRRIFEICHWCLGWTIFMFIIYHSLFYIFSYFQGENIISVNYIITGLITTVAMVILILTGMYKNETIRNFNIKIKSLHLSHILMTIIFAILIVFHFNFR